MRTLAGILLTAALLLGLFGLAECFPGPDERAQIREVQRLSGDGRPSEILSHVQTNVRQARESRTQAQAVTVCFPMAAFLFYFGWIASTRVQMRLLHLQCIGSILLTSALLLGFYGFVDCFPGSYERALKEEIQRFPTGERSSVLLLNLRYARLGRIQSATACFVMAALLSYVGWLAITRPEARGVGPLREGPIILPAKPNPLFLRRLSAVLLGRTERIQKARAGLRPKLETLFERHAAKEDGKTAG